MKQTRFGQNETQERWIERGILHL